MPVSTQGKLSVICPHCGHEQLEPRAAISTICKKCRRHFEVQQTSKPAARPRAVPAERPKQQRRVTCFDCGTELEVALAAESTMCKRCGRYVDLHDFRITSAVSKNFKTKGSFVVEPKGYVFNTEAIVGEAVIKGRFHGKLVAEQSLTIFSTAEIKGSFKAGKLVIPAENNFRWKDLLVVGGAEISGELVADINAAKSVNLKSSARVFGDISADNLTVEEGAVLVGYMRIGAGSKKAAGG